jgi:hypothetical protein
MIVGWIAGTLAACVLITALWAIGWWPADNTISFLAGMPLGCIGGLVGLYIATETE